MIPLLAGLLRIRLIRETWDRKGIKRDWIREIGETWHEVLAGFADEWKE